MLSESVLELLTAAVDGELTPAQRKRLDRILTESSEARQTLEQLRRDAARLRRLPSQKAPADLANQIMASIRDLQPIRPREAVVNLSSLPAWTSLAAAAVVLMAISLGSYLYFASSQDHQRHREIVERNPTTPIVPDNSPPRGGLIAQQPPVEPEAIPAPRVLPEVVVDQRPNPLELLPLPRPQESNALFAPSDAPLVPRVVETPRLPLIVAIKDVDTPAVRERLARELQGKEAIRIELFCKDANRGMERLQAALKSSHRPMLDVGVEERLKKKVPSQWAFFTDSFSAEEAQSTLNALNKGEPIFDRMVLTAFQSGDQTELGQMLGLTSGNVFRYRTSQKIRPFQETTPEQLAANLAQRTSASPGENAPKMLERSILVLSYPVPKANSLGSPVIKSFLDQRREPAAGQFPVLLIIRQRIG